MTFRALWNDLRFYFRFDITGSKILTFTNTNHKMEVVDSDRVEMFFRANNQLNPYYCLEIDPLGRILDYKARFYRQFDYEWKWPGEKQLEVQSAFTAAGYFVDGSISLGSLKELGLLRNQVLETGLFRGECLKLPDPESDFNWISWVRPESQHPDFHIPSAFGRIKLVTGKNILFKCVKSKCILLSFQLNKTHIRYETNPVVLIISCVHDQSSGHGTG